MELCRVFARALQPKIFYVGFVIDPFTLFGCTRSAVLVLVLVLVAEYALGSVGGDSPIS